MASDQLLAVVEIARLAVVAAVWLATATFSAALALSVLAWWTAHRLRMRELGLPGNGRVGTGQGVVDLRD